MGKLLVVNLIDGEMHDEPLNEDWCRDFIGGGGYGCRYLIDKLSKDTDSLGPENTLMVMTGPLTATSAPTGGRWMVCAKSPLSGIWGESNCGGEFGWQLKSTGYDGIVLTGAAATPTYLSIIHGEATLQDASDIWGLGAFETHRILKEKAGDNLAKVACIGPAGEKLVKYASIASEERAAGRTGMGAVMGSKKLKAIVVRGNQKVELEDPEAFKELANESSKLVMEPFTTNMFKDLGTSGGMDFYNMQGELPVKFYRKGGFDGSYNTSGATMKEKILVKNRHCWGCPIGCGRIVEVKEEGPWQTPVTEGPEYETLAGYGAFILNDNLEAIAKINMTCNDLGIDTISSSTVIAMLMDLFEQGKITADDVDGLEVKWGDAAMVLQLLQKISARDGIGDVLAEGADAVGQKFGVDQEEIPTVDHVEAPYHDLRSSFGMAIAYGLGPFGASHCACDMYQVCLGQPFPEIGVNIVDKFEINETLAETSALVHDFRAFTNAIIICNWAVFAESKMGQLVQLATGIPMGIPEIKVTGKRLIELKRLFNLKMGLDSSWDRLPRILVAPLPDGGAADKSPDWRKLFQLYYAARQWDENGVPKKEMLESLGLQDIAI